MIEKSFLSVTSLMFALACADAPARENANPIGADGIAIAPVGLNVTARAGGCGVLELVALTLKRGTSHGELYAALKNNGTSPACSPSFSVEVSDQAEQPLATGLGGLLVKRFYRLTDGSDTVAGCVGPGDVAMVAITDLPAELALEDVGRVIYGCNFWMLDVAPIAGIRIDDVKVVTRGNEASYTGALVNGLDVAWTKPSVAVFPVNSVGRPLGVAFGDGQADVLPGGSWRFETDTVAEAGADCAAYPAHG